MDQLHEELKEPLTECSMGGEGSDGDERRDGDRSPSEDEFLSCDSGSSSDRGEVGGLGEGELLLQDECDGFRSPSVGVVAVGSGTVISEKERLKQKRVSGSPLRGGSQEMDEDADVDTAAEDGVPERAEEEQSAPSANTDVQEDNQTSTAGQGQVQSNNTSGNRQPLKKKKLFSHIFLNCTVELLLKNQTMKYQWPSHSPLPAVLSGPCRSCIPSCPPIHPAPARSALQDLPTPSRKVKATRTITEDFISLYSAIFGSLTRLEILVVLHI